MKARVVNLVIREFESGRVSIKGTFDPPIEAATGDKSMGMSAIVPIMLPLLTVPDVVIQYNGVTNLDNEPFDVKIPLQTIEISGTPVLKK